MKLLITLLLSLSAALYAQNPQETDMPGAKSKVHFGTEPARVINQSHVERSNNPLVKAVKDYAVTTDLNSTPAQLAAKYGKPAKIEKSWVGAGVAYGFAPTKYTYVYTLTDPSGGRIEDVLYFRFDTKWASIPYPKEEQTRLFNSNLDPHIAWLNGRNEYSASWDGCDWFRKLGNEEWIRARSSVTGSRQVVGTVRVVTLPTGKKIEGYSVRTRAQFNLEQPFMVPKVIGTVTTGAVKKVN